VLQHKDQLFLLGEKKRGRRPRPSALQQPAGPEAIEPSGAQDLQAGALKDA
jgi:hypothetical protein